MTYSEAQKQDLVKRGLEQIEAQFFDSGNHAVMALIAAAREELVALNASPAYSKEHRMLDAIRAEVKKADTRPDGGRAFYYAAIREIIDPVQPYHPNGEPWDVPPWSFRGATDAEMA